MGIWVSSDLPKPGAAGPSPLGAPTLLWPAANHSGFCITSNPHEKKTQNSKKITFSLNFSMKMEEPPWTSSLLDAGDRAGLGNALKIKGSIVVLARDSCCRNVGAQHSTAGLGMHWELHWELHWERCRSQKPLGGCRHCSVPAGIPLQVRSLSSWDPFPVLSPLYQYHHGSGFCP